MRALAAIAMFLLMSVAIGLETYIDSSVVAKVTMISSMFLTCDGIK